MQRFGWIALFVVLGAGCVCAQQAGLGMTPQGAPAQPEHVKVYSVEPGVAAPVMLPLELGPAPMPNEKCEKKFDGNTKLSLLVDTRGQPRNIMFLKPLGTELDRFALRVAGADRFNPGTMDGSPVVVAGTLEVKLETCIVEATDTSGAKSYGLRLRSAPVQEFNSIPRQMEEAVLWPDDQAWRSPKRGAGRLYHVGGNVTAPVVLNSVEAKYSEEGQKRNISGACWISMIVDVQGMPQDARVTKPLGYGLDEQAMAAASQYRFKPAMIENGPVPVMITVVVNFRMR